ncbi:cation/H(+) antiporter 15-like [Papaver somniferum]|uniref:cation/H(+) antiporter 15-like n=1 Tax=Papaver somniferum TaxID=3469 RepID=UPI000E6FA60F|nr:cation/H(+) antiporter 15-like [Papaver somniferum]
MAGSSAHHWLQRWKYYRSILPVCNSWSTAHSDSFLLALIMNLKGIVEVSILNIWIDSQNAKVCLHRLKGNFIFGKSVIVFAVVLISAIITPLVKYLYDPSTRYLRYKRSSVLQSKQNKLDFRVLVCVHTQDDVPTIIRLLEATNPTKYHPLTLYILRLVELVGRASPLLISHPRYRRASSSSNASKSERIVNAFQQLEDRYLNLVTIQGFSTISPYASMHNDICTMSADKRTSLIIFPYCRQDVISLRDDLARPNISNRSIKTLLQNLLRNSPCSVGILIDGKNYQAQSIHFLPDRPFRVTVLFFGGPDDREALAFAMNMIHHPSVFVTVIRFYGPTSSSTPGEVNDFLGGSGSIDVQRYKLLDEELVDQYKINAMHDETLTYKEVDVKDAAETIWAVQSIHDDFDLMLVGRQQITDSDIINASVFDADSPEFEDLGAIGDLVASPDYDIKGSILIIHQRQDIT